MPPVITREQLEQDDSNPTPLDEDDIALLKTYVSIANYYALRLFMELTRY